MPSLLFEGQQDLHRFFFNLISKLEDQSSYFLNLDEDSKNGGPGFFPEKLAGMLSLCHFYLIFPTVYSTKTVVNNTKKQQEMK